MAVSVYMPLLVVFATALSVAWVTTPFVERVARRFGFIDRPSPRRDALLKPRLGGLAMYAAFATALAVSVPLVPRDDAEARRVIGILLGGAVMLVTGAADDRLDLKAAPQLIAQLVAATVAIAAGVVIAAVTNPFGDPITNSMIVLPIGLAHLFTLAWLVGSINTVNFLDGVDGLAVGVGAEAAAILGLHSLLIGQYSIAALAAALVGCCLGFLPHNFFPARITMGSSGAAFLGFALGTLAIVGGAKTATLLLVLGLPIADTGWAVLRRVSQGRSPFVGDRGHLHHVLLDLGWKPSQIVLLVYAVCGTLGLLALLLSTRLEKLVAIGSVMVLLAVGLTLANQLRGARAKRVVTPSQQSIDPPKSM